MSTVADTPASGEAVPSFGVRLGGFALVCVELALVLLVVRHYDIAASNHFFPVLCLVAGGFLVHAWLPARLRAAFFCLLSLGGLLFVLGWPDGARVIAIGGGLIAVCYLPVPFGMRVCAVALAALMLTVLRMEANEPFWPVLGSMFMFRMIVYLYELRRAAARPPLDLTVAYFFPIPNVCFLFFPVLDFRTFRDTYRADAGWEAAQTGVAWIVRGLSHVLAYRVIKYYLLPAPNELSDLPHLVLFMAAGYALYLHVSGYFHIITGVLRLFGFELPRTHYHYFLASSLTDIWRRINIYWKDFMTRVFFLPAFFALRGWGTKVAVVAAALGVFLATWLLHTYQTFWITGKLPLGLNHLGLWLVVGVLVAGNLLFDLARARRPAAGPQPFTLWDAAGRSLRVVGMFLLVSFFWACWNTPSVLVLVRERGLSGAGWVLGFVLLAVVVGVVGQIVWPLLTRLGLRPRPSPAASVLAHTAALAVLALLAVPRVAGVFGPKAAEAIATLRRESATPVEAAVAVQGYYEEITDGHVRAGPWLASLEGRAKPPDAIHYREMTRDADDLLERELIPDWSGEVAGSRLTTNRFAMRDRPDRSQSKPPNTCRIALVGSSVVMGYGVGDDEPFPRLLEERLNARRRPDGPRYEVLNFGTGRSFVIQRHVLIDRKVLGFEPDAIYYVAHQDELLGPVRHLARLVGNGVRLPYPCLDEVVRKARIGPDTMGAEIEVLLQPFAREIVLGVYRDLVGVCRRRGILPVWVYLPMPGVVNAPPRTEELAKLAEEAGFEVVNLSDWADGHRPGEVKLGEGEHHPNRLGHQIIAGRLEAILAARPELLPAGARLRP